jgi:hypothetical protein
VIKSRPREQESRETKAHFLAVGWPSGARVVAGDAPNGRPESYTVQSLLITENCVNLGV